MTDLPWFNNFGAIHRRFTVTRTGSCIENSTLGWRSAVKARIKLSLPHRVSNFFMQIELDCGLMINEIFSKPFANYFKNGQVFMYYSWIFIRCLSILFIYFPSHFWLVVTSYPLSGQVQAVLFRSSTKQSAVRKV